MEQFFQFLNSFDVWIWFSLLVIFVVVEGFTMSLTTIWGAIACVPLIFISLSSLNFNFQFLIFVVLTFVLVLLTRPFAVKKLNLGKFKTSIEDMEGMDFLVQETVSGFKTGRVKGSNGVEWNAKTADGGEIQPGKICTVLRVEGNTLIVKCKD